MGDDKTTLLITRAAKGILWWYRNEERSDVSVDKLEWAATELGKIHNELLSLGVTWEQIHRINKMVYSMYQDPYFEITPKGVKNLISQIL